MNETIDFDGLCGVIYMHASSDKQVRCKYEFGHGGPHSYEKNLPTFRCGIRLMDMIFTHPVNLNSQDPNRNKPYCEECQNLTDSLSMGEEEIRRLKK